MCPGEVTPGRVLDVVLGLFGPQLLGNKGKFPAGACLMGAAGVLGKSGHFRNGRAWAYEHRLGSNSVYMLCKNQPYGLLRKGKAYKVLGPLFLVVQF